MRADNILDQIDGALHDWTVSGDAMRSRPARQPQSATVSVMGADGRWEEIGGITSIDFHIEPPTIDPEFTRAWREFHDRLARVEVERVQRAAVLLESLVRAFQGMRAAAEAASRGITGLAEAMDDNQPVCEHKPLPRRDRPAWQSPYGPPRRR